MNRKSDPKKLEEFRKSLSHLPPNIDALSLDEISITTVLSRKQLLEKGINSDVIIEQRLTDDQRECARLAFRHFDTYETGLVATSQLRELLRMLGFNPTEEEVQEVTNEYEIAEVREFDFQEFMFILAPLLVQNDLDVELSEMVRAFDPGRIGAVEVMEIRSILEQLTELNLHEMSEEEIDRMLNFIDYNHDGLLSVNELKRAVDLYQQ